MGAMAQTAVEGMVSDSAAWFQESLKAPIITSMDVVVVDGAPVVTDATVAMASEDVVADVADDPQPRSMEEALPVHVISDIINMVKDARDLANCMATSKTMNEAVQDVRSLSLVCQKRYYDLARERFPIRRPCANISDDEEEYDVDQTDSDDSEVEEEEVEAVEEAEHEDEEEGEEDNDDDDDDDDDDDESCEWSSAPIAPDACCGRSAPLRGHPGYLMMGSSSSSSKQPVHVSFKNACLNMLHHVKKVEQLRIEVDTEMQANLFQKEEIHMVDFWLSEPMFVRKWVSLCSQSLRHLTLVDYGQQAIMRQSPIIRVLSESCKNLQHLELRNMYLDTSELEILPQVHSLTLRCIKMTEKSLMEITDAMPELVTLALVSVFGVLDARISSPNLQVVCLGLSTSAKTVDLDLPSCTKLQLKMTCPDSLRVCAPQLAYVAVCMEKRDGAVVEFDNVHNLKELLFGASHFQTLSKLMLSNRHLEKLFLDVPCMSLGEDGKWEGVLDQIPRTLPDIEALRSSCPALHMLSVGPGLWHAMEEAFLADHTLAAFRRWPALSKLIVHMVVQSLDTCVSVLHCLASAIPSLQSLEVYVHLDSPVNLHRFDSVCRSRLPSSSLQLGTWKRSLNFACFSF